MNQDLIKQVANLLFVTYSSTSSTERGDAESRLLSMSSDYSNYFEVLLCIVTSQMSANTKNAAGMHLKKLVKECMENNWLVADEIEL
jgi:hypothetical protein